MKVELITKLNGRRLVIPLRTAVAVIGRARGNAVRIPSAEVSRRHCRFLLKDGTVILEDMDSVNGTFLNGKRLKSPQAVYPGDEVEVGPVRFQVEYELPDQGKSRIPPRENSVSLLEALADGDVMEVEPLDDLPELEEIDPVPPRSVGNSKARQASPPPPPVEDDLAPLPVDFDLDAQGWQLPGASDLRGLLDEEPTRPAKPTQKRSRE